MILSIQRISKSYNTNTTKALDNVSIDLTAGVHALLCLKYVKKTVALIFIVLLVGCTSTDIREDSYIEGKDFQFMYDSQQDTLMAESKDGYYFFSGLFLYYVNKASMSPIILCNRPNCMHEEEVDSEKIPYCNAFVPRPNYLTVYEENIYMLSQLSPRDLELIKMSLDGTNRKSIFSYVTGVSTGILHRGIYYYATLSWDSNQKSVYSLNSVNINKLHVKPKVLHTGTFNNGTFNALNCRGNNLFFDEVELNETGLIQKNYRLDLLENKLHSIIEDKKDMLLGGKVIFKDKIHYSLWEVYSNGAPIRSEFWVSDLNGNNISSDKDTKLKSPLVDLEYFYLNDLDAAYSGIPQSAMGLTILDSNFNELDFVKLGQFKSSTVLPGGSKHLFVQVEVEDKFQVYYVNKDEFGSHNVQLKLLFEIDADKRFPAVIMDIPKK